MIDAGLVVLAAFVSPYKKDRDNIRTIVKDVNFVEVYVNTSIEECERRDTKGLYDKITDLSIIIDDFEKSSHFKIKSFTCDIFQSYFYYFGSTIRILIH